MQKENMFIDHNIQHLYIFFVVFFSISVVKHLLILQAVLQMSNQRVPLLGEEENESLHQLDGNATINEVIQHEVKDIGTHM